MPEWNPVTLPRLYPDSQHFSSNFNKYLHKLPICSWLYASHFPTFAEFFVTTWATYDHTSSGIPIGIDDVRQQTGNARMMHSGKLSCFEENLLPIYTADTPIRVWSQCAKFCPRCT